MKKNYLVFFLIFFIFSHCSKKNPFYGVDEEDITGPLIYVDYPSETAVQKGTFSVNGRSQDASNEVLKIEYRTYNPLTSSWSSWERATGTVNWSFSINSLAVWGAVSSQTRIIQIKATDTNYKPNETVKEISYTINNSNLNTINSINDVNDLNIDTYRNISEGAVITYSWSATPTAVRYSLALFENGAQLGSSQDILNGSGSATFGTITASYVLGSSGSNSFQFTGTDGKYYYIVVIPYDGSFDLSTQTSSVITLDLTSRAVGGASVVDPGGFSAQVNVQFTWSGFTESGSGISYYEIASSDDGTNWSTSQNIGLATSITTSGYDTEVFDDGETVYLRVRAIDKAGNSSSWVVSNGIVINLAVGTVGAISHNGGGDLDRDASDGNRVVQFSWADLSDAVGYKIQVYETVSSESDDYQALKNAGGILPDPGTLTGITGVTLTTLAGTTTFQFTGQDGKKYFIKVKAYDDAGNESSSWTKSAAIMVDITAPAAGTVIDTANGIPAYLGLYLNSLSVNFSWSGFTDAGSGIDYYEIESSNDGATWSSTQNAGLSSSVSTSGYAGGLFADGTVVYLRVRAVDKAGNTSGWAVSDGIRIDTTPPNVAAVLPVTTKIGARQGSIAWSDASDAGSGVDYYVIEVTHSNDPVCYFTVRVDAARSGVSNITEYYSSSVINELTVALDASVPKQVQFTWDVAATADYTTVIIRVYDKAGNVSQSYMSAEVNVF